MTAPTPGKEPGGRWGWGGSLRRLWALPNRPSRPSLALCLAPFSPRAPGERGPLLPFLRARRPLPTSLRSWHLTLPGSRSSGRVRPLLARTLGLDRCGWREPQVSGRTGRVGGGRCHSRGHSALPRLRGRLGTPLSAAVCARSLGPGFHREAPGTGPAARRRGARSWGRREVVTLPRGVRGAERRARGERPAR